MAPHPKIRQAFEAARSLGIPYEEIRPILKKLLKLYDKKWELIEEDNYRTLLDAYFQSKEEKIASCSGVRDMNQNDLERPAKRMQLGEQASASPGTVILFVCF